MVLDRRPRRAEILRAEAGRGDRVARSKIPGPLERRRLIERDMSEAQALTYAESYLAEGRTVEAIDFLCKAGAQDRLESLRSEAVQSGDLFLFRAVAQATRQVPQSEEWSALARAAEAAGKELDPPLSLAQYRLLELLYDEPGRVYSRDEVVKAVWPEDDREGISEQAIDAMARRLRERLAEADPDVQYVITVRGHGFRLENAIK